MNKYFEIKYFVEFILPISLLCLLILWIVISLVFSYIKFHYDRLTKVNCRKCKNYSYWSNALGNEAWYGCSLYKWKERKYIGHNYNFKKCSDFEEEQ